MFKNLNQYETISSKNDGLYSASFLDNKKVSIISQNEILNYNFSKRVQDNIEVSVFDSVTQDLIGWKPIYGDITSQEVQSSYTNLSGEIIDNSFIKELSNFYILYDENSYSNVIIDPISDIQDFGLSENSSYILGYNPLSNRVGNFNRPIFIKEVSPSGKEVKINVSEKVDPITLSEFNNFLNNKFNVKIIVDNLLNKIQSYRIERLFDNTKNFNVDTIDSLKFNYSLKTDIDVVNFLNDMMSPNKTFSIFYQFKNWLYENYNGNLSKTEMLQRYRELSSYIIKKSLYDKSSYIGKSYQSIVDYINGIFDSIFIISIETTFSEYNRERLEPLRLILNLGNNHFYHVLKWKSSNGDMILKLSSPIDKKLSVGTPCYISRIVSDNIFLDFSPYSIFKEQTFELVPPDLSLFNTNDSNQIYYKYPLTDEQANRLQSKNKELEVSEINVDYTNFENFVRFSSAEYRINSFQRKKQTINDLETLNADLNFIGDAYSIQEISGNLNTIYTIKNSFDGYERFLYENSDWENIHTLDYFGSTSASMYDRENPNSLQNNLPKYILEDDSNLDFVKFVNVIGHHFDNIFSTIHQFNDSKFSDSFGSEKLFEKAVQKMLIALGWDSSYSTSDIFLEMFGEDKYGNIIESKSGYERKQIIWKRFVNALPYILKTKGTEECIRILFNVYGIPRSLYKIREYNSVPNIDSSAKNEFVFDNEHFALHYDGSGEYLQTSWSQDIQSVEFKVSFDPEKIHPDGSVFRLLSMDENWVVGALRDTLDPILGKMFFTLTEDPSDPNSIKTIATQNVPLFDGNIYSVLLRKNDLIVDSDNTILYEFSSSLVPRKFDLIVQKSLEDRISIQSSASFVFNSDFCDSFSGTNSTSSSVYIGNYNQIVTSSLIADIDAFYGTMDEIKFYKSPLSQDRFDAHTKYINAFDIDSYENLENDLSLYLNFDNPINLFTTSSYVELENKAFSSSIGNIHAYNFPILGTSASLSYDPEYCVEYPAALYEISSSFPWHFKSFRTREFVLVPNFGGSSPNNNKVYLSEGIPQSSFLFEDASVVDFSANRTYSNPNVGVFLSPTDSLNLEILQFFGDINVGDFIGSPSDMYERTYKDFKKFRRTFFKHFNGINFNSYINIVKNYVDSSIFKNIEKIVPVRSKLKTGILIEPSILERNKIQQRPLSIENDMTFDSSIDVNTDVDSNILYTEKYGDTIQLQNNLSNSTSNNPLFGNYVEKEKVFTFSNGDIIIKTGEKHTLQRVRKTSFMNVLENGKVVRREVVFYDLNLIPSGSDSTGIRFRRRRRRSPFRRKSTQTTETTLAEPSIDAEKVPQETVPWPILFGSGMIPTNSKTSFFPFSKAIAGMPPTDNSFVGPVVTVVPLATGGESSAVATEFEMEAHIPPSEIMVYEISAAESDSGNKETVFINVNNRGGENDPDKNTIVFVDNVPDAVTGVSEDNSPPFASTKTISSNNIKYTSTNKRLIQDESAD